MKTKKTLIIAGIMLFALSASAQTKKNVKTKKATTTTVKKTTTTTAKKAAKSVVVENPTLVDLGLPSGTKWADRNINASSQTAAGGYYAFGETSEKKVYDKDTYTFKADLSDIAGTEYDAATKKYGEGWSIPTPDQWKELIANSKQEVTMVNNQFGIKFTGKNNNSIFIPAPYTVWKAGTKEETDNWSKKFKEGLTQSVTKSDVEKLKLLGMTLKAAIVFYRTSNKDLVYGGHGVLTIARNGVTKERNKELAVTEMSAAILGFLIRPVFCGKTTSTTTSSSNTDNSGDGNFVVY